MKFCTTRIKNIQYLLTAKNKLWFLNISLKILLTFKELPKHKFTHKFGEQFVGNMLYEI